MSSCGSANCSCGSSCSCGNGCGCKKYQDIEVSTTATTLIAGLAPSASTKMYSDEAESISEGGNGCKCGSSCKCDPCTC